MTKSFFNNLKQILKNCYKNKADKDFYQAKINELQNLVTVKDFELEKLRIKLINKENDFKKQNEMLFLKEEELMGYINKIFEQQERERIVKWIVNSIREYLDLDKVLETAVEEIGKLLKVDRCLISLFNRELTKFNIIKIFRANEDIVPITDNECISNILMEWFNCITETKTPIVVNDSTKLVASKEQEIYYEKYNIKSFAIIPIVHNEEILGAISVHQTQFQRDWNSSHIEIIKDIASQIDIAIRQASLYTQAQEATRLKSEFLASMSHEFRTPLNAIIGFSEMLLSSNYGNLSNKQREYLNNIAVSGKHLLRLVNDILDLSKVESGNIELRYEKFSSRKAIEEIISMLSTLAQKKNISINVCLQDVRLKADVDRFKQIMYNLLSNAIKFTEDGGKIYLSSSLNDGKLKVEVQDTGIGISDKDRSKIFSQFVQIDSSYARKQEGTGLGLTLIKKIIEMHNGEINFESEIGKGSIFWFTLPEAELSEDLI